MPNRIIKESICTSEKINGLSDFHFRMYVSLITYVDDFGRGDARPAIIKGRCFPLREKITTKDIQIGLQVLAETGCITLYTVSGEPYFCFPKWTDHQRVRNMQSKYPGPDEADADCGQLTAIDSNCQQLNSIDGNCEQLTTNVAVIQSNPIQSESNPNPNPKRNPRGACADSSEDFEKFWTAYPRKEAKQAAKKAFEKLKPDEGLLDTMLKAIERFKGTQQWQEDGGRYIPHPATWINQRRWEDEMNGESARSSGSSESPKSKWSEIGEQLVL